MQSQAKKYNAIKGISVVLFSLFLYAYSDALVKMLLNKNYSVEQVTFLRAVSRLIPLIIALLLFYRSLAPLKTNRPWAHLINAVIGCGRTYAFMWAFKLIPLAEASALSYTSAIFFVILSVVFLNEKLQRYHIIAIVLGAIGVVIAYRPGFEIFRLGALVTLVGAFFASVNKIIIRKLSFHDNSLGIIIYPNIFLILISLPFISESWKPLDYDDWLLLIAIGAMAALSQYGFAIAIKLTKGLSLAPYDYTYFCWIIVMDYLFNNEIPTEFVLVGAVFIIAGNAVILMEEFKKAKEAKKLAAQV
ncbi:MAG: DMT family transporter [Alphaproteobacteria bacterium]|nr:DMT family transporter [Alphaproteobacteria bacterium]OJV12027.1 MAG: hypothetical protein BGO27_00375 [Alphaproteobacteria bacterium 33-17]